MLLFLLQWYLTGFHITKPISQPHGCDGDITRQSHRHHHSNVIPAIGTVVIYAQYMIKSVGTEIQNFYVK